MANNRFVWAGLDELKAELRTLPADLANEAGVIVQSHAHTAAAAIRDAYGQHRRSGDLADGVVVETVASGPLGVGLIVRSRSKHAWLFEHGSQARHWMRGKLTGRMPPTPTFIPTTIRFRRAMYEALADLLRAHGLIVAGAVDHAA